MTPKFQLIFLPVERDRDFNFSSVQSCYLRVTFGSEVRNVVVHSLRGAAKFMVKNGKTVLYLDGTRGTYAETSTVPFQQTDLTIAVWIKLVSPLTKEQEIYADWSNPWQFRFGIHPDGRLYFQGRRNVAWISDMMVVSTRSR